MKHCRSVYCADGSKKYQAKLWCRRENIALADCAGVSGRLLHDLLRTAIRDQRHTRIPDGWSEVAPPTISGSLPCRGFEDRHLMSGWSPGSSDSLSNSFVTRYDFSIATFPGDGLSGASSWSMLPRLSITTAQCATTPFARYCRAERYNRFLYCAPIGPIGVRSRPAKAGCDAL